MKESRVICQIQGKLAGYLLASEFAVGGAKEVLLALIVSYRDLLDEIESLDANEAGAEGDSCLMVEQRVESMAAVGADITYAEAERLSADEFDERFCEAVSIFKAVVGAEEV